MYFKLQTMPLSIKSALVVLVLIGTPAQAGVPVPDIPKPVGKGDQCVEETPFMRTNHMELILHQRDETVQRGIRTKKHSFKECINCHVVKDEHNIPVSFKSPKHFCNTCHTYAAVRIDCFECHASRPGNFKLSLQKKNQSAMDKH